MNDLYISPRVRRTTSLSIFVPSSVGFIQNLSIDGPAIKNNGEGPCSLKRIQAEGIDVFLFSGMVQYYTVGNEGTGFISIKLSTNIDGETVYETEPTIHSTSSSVANKGPFERRLRIGGTEHVECLDKVRFRNKSTLEPVVIFDPSLMDKALISILESLRREFVSAKKCALLVKQRLGIITWSSPTTHELCKILVNIYGSTGVHGDLQDSLNLPEMKVTDVSSENNAWIYKVVVTFCLTHSDIKKLFEGITSPAKMSKFLTCVCEVMNETPTGGTPNGTDGETTISELILSIDRELSSPLFVEPKNKGTGCLGEVGNESASLRVMDFVDPTRVNTSISKLLFLAQTTDSKTLNDVVVVLDKLLVSNNDEYDKRFDSSSSPDFFDSSSHAEELKSTNLLLMGDGDTIGKGEIMDGNVNDANIVVTNPVYIDPHINTIRRIIKESITRVLSLERNKCSASLLFGVIDRHPYVVGEPEEVLRHIIEFAGMLECSVNGSSETRTAVTKEQIQTRAERLSEECLSLGNVVQNCTDVLAMMGDARMKLKDVAGKMAIDIVMMSRRCSTYPKCRINKETPNAPLDVLVLLEEPSSVAPDLLVSVLGVKADRGIQGVMELIERYINTNKSGTFSDSTVGIMAVAIGHIVNNTAPHEIVHGCVKLLNYVSDVSEQMNMAQRRVLIDSVVPRVRSCVRCSNGDPFAVLVSLVEGLLEFMEEGKRHGVSMTLNPMRPIIDRAIQDDVIALIEANLGREPSVADAGKVRKTSCFGEKHIYIYYLYKIGGIGGSFEITKAVAKLEAFITNLTASRVNRKTLALFRNAVEVGMATEADKTERARKLIQRIYDAYITAAEFNNQMVDMDLSLLIQNYETLESINSVWESALNELVDTCDIFSKLFLLAPELINEKRLIESLLSDGHIVPNNRTLLDPNIQILTAALTPSCDVPIPPRVRNNIVYSAMLRDKFHHAHFSHTFQHFYHLLAAEITKSVVRVDTRMEYSRPPKQLGDGDVDILASVIETKTTAAVDALPSSSISIVLFGNTIKIPEVIVPFIVDRANIVVQDVEQKQQMDELEDEFEFIDEPESCTKQEEIDALVYSSKRCVSPNNTSGSRTQKLGNTLLLLIEFISLSFDSCTINLVSSATSSLRSNMGPQMAVLEIFEEIQQEEIPWEFSYLGTYQTFSLNIVVNTDRSVLDTGMINQPNPTMSSFDIYEILELFTKRRLFFDTAKALLPLFSSPSVSCQLTPRDIVLKKLATTLCESSSGEMYHKLPISTFISSSIALYSYASLIATVLFRVVEPSKIMEIKLNKKEQTQKEEEVYPKSSFRTKRFSSKKSPTIHPDALTAVKRDSFKVRHFNSEFIQSGLEFLNSFVSAAPYAESLRQIKELVLGLSPDHVMSVISNTFEDNGSVQGIGSKSVGWREVVKLVDMLSDETSVINCVALSAPYQSASSALASINTFLLLHMPIPSGSEGTRWSTDDLFLCNSQELIKCLDESSRILRVTVDSAKRLLSGLSNAGEMSLGALTTIKLALNSEMYFLIASELTDQPWPSAALNPDDKSVNSLWDITPECDQILAMALDSGKRGDISPRIKLYMSSAFHDNPSKWLSNLNNKNTQNVTAEQLKNAKAQVLLELGESGIQPGPDENNHITEGQFAECFNDNDNIQKIHKRKVLLYRIFLHFISLIENIVDGVENLISLGYPLFKKGQQIAFVSFRTLAVARSGEQLCVKQQNARGQSGNTEEMSVTWNPSAFEELDLVLHNVTTIRKTFTDFLLQIRGDAEPLGLLNGCEIRMLFSFGCPGRGEDTSEIASVCWNIINFLIPHSTDQQITSILAEIKSITAKVETVQDVISVLSGINSIISKQQKVECDSNSQQLSLNAAPETNVNRETNELCYDTVKDAVRILTYGNSVPETPEFDGVVQCHVPVNRVYKCIHVLFLSNPSKPGTTGDATACDMPNMHNLLLCTPLTTMDEVHSFISRASNTNNPRFGGVCNGMNKRLFVIAFANLLNYSLLNEGVTKLVSSRTDHLKLAIIFGTEADITLDGREVTSRKPQKGYSLPFRQHNVSKRDLEKPIQPINSFIVWGDTPGCGKTTTIMNAVNNPVDLLVDHVENYRQIVIRDTTVNSNRTHKFTSYDKSLTRHISGRVTPSSITNLLLPVIANLRIHDGGQLRRNVVNPQRSTIHNPDTLFNSYIHLDIGRTDDMLNSNLSESNTMKTSTQEYDINVAMSGISTITLLHTLFSITHMHALRLNGIILSIDDIHDAALNTIKTNIPDPKLIELTTTVFIECQATFGNHVMKLLRCVLGYNDTNCIRPSFSWPSVVTNNCVWPKCRRPLRNGVMPPSLMSPTWFKLSKSEETNQLESFSDATDSKPSLKIQQAEQDAAYLAQASRQESAALLSEQDSAPIVYKSGLDINDARLCSTAILTIAKYQGLLVSRSPGKNGAVSENPISSWDPSSMDAATNVFEITRYLQLMFILDLSSYHVRQVLNEEITYRLVIETISIYSKLLNLFAVNDFYSEYMLGELLMNSNPELKGEELEMSVNTIRIIILEALLAEARSSSVGIKKSLGDNNHNSSDIVSWNEKKRFMVLFNFRNPSSSLSYWHPSSVSLNPSADQSTFPAPLLDLFVTQSPNRNYKLQDFNRLTNDEIRENLKAVFCLENDNSIYNIDRQYVLTPDNSYKMLLINTRLLAGLPVVLQGEAGVGKTRLVRFLASLLGADDANNGVDRGHFGTGYGVCKLLALTLSEATDISTIILLCKVANLMSDIYEQVLLFIDEINASMLIDEVDYLIRSRTIRDVQLRGNISIITAMNPHKDSQTLHHITGGTNTNRNNDTEVISSAESTFNIGKLVYRVYQPSPALLALTTDFGSLHPIDEERYIISIVAEGIREITVNRSAKMISPGFVPSSRSQLNPDKLQSTWITLTSQAIAGCHRILRGLQDGLAPSASLRDCRRCMQLISFFLAYEDMFAPPMPSASNTSQGGLVKSGSQGLTGFVRALALGLYITYIVRLHNTEDRKRMLAAVAEALVGKSNDGMADYIRNNNNSAATDASSPLIPPLYATIRTAKTSLLSVMPIPPGIALNSALQENIFVLFVCIATRIPCIIIGPPGTSKTLALNILLQFYRKLNGVRSLVGQKIKEDQQSGDKNIKEKLERCSKIVPQIVPVSYQGSANATSAGILRCAERAKDATTLEGDSMNPLGGQTQAVYPIPTLGLMIFDELGLAQSASSNPLKVLHELLEPTGSALSTKDVVCEITEEELAHKKGNKYTRHVKRPKCANPLHTTNAVLRLSFVGLSNHPLDSAPASRSIILFRQQPSHTELVMSLREICLASWHKYDCDNKWKYGGNQRYETDKPLDEYEFGDTELQAAQHVATACAVAHSQAMKLVNEELKKLDSRTRGDRKIPNWVGTRDIYSLVKLAAERQYDKSSLVVFEKDFNDKKAGRVKRQGKTELTPNTLAMIVARCYCTPVTALTGYGKDVIQVDNDTTGQKDSAEVLLTQQIQGLRSAREANTSETLDKIIDLFKVAFLKAPGTHHTQPSSIEVTLDNIRDTSEAARHLLLITDTSYHFNGPHLRDQVGDSGITSSNSFIINALRRHTNMDTLKRDVVVIRGSTYEDDRKDNDYNNNVIRSIVSAASGANADSDSGRIIFLISVRNVLGALFDLLNKCYMTDGGDDENQKNRSHSVCKVALGGSSDCICTINNNTRIVIVMSDVEACQEELALLQRLEKVFISSISIIRNDDHLSILLGNITTAYKVIPVTSSTLFNYAGMVSDAIVASAHIGECEKHEGDNDHILEAVCKLLCFVTPLAAALKFVFSSRGRFADVSLGNNNLCGPLSIERRLFEMMSNGVGAFPCLSLMIETLTQDILSSKHKKTSLRVVAHCLGTVSTTAIDAAFQNIQATLPWTDNESDSRDILGLGAATQGSSKNVVLQSPRQNDKLSMSIIDITGIRTIAALRANVLGHAETIKPKTGFLVITVRGEESRHLETLLTVLAGAPEDIHIVVVVSDPPKDVKLSLLCGWTPAVVDSLVVPQYLEPALMMQKQPGSSKNIVIQQLLDLKLNVTVTPHAIGEFLLPALYSFDVNSPSFFKRIPKTVSKLKEALLSGFSNENNTPDVYNGVVMSFYMKSISSHIACLSGGTWFDSVSDQNTSLLFGLEESATDTFKIALVGVLRELVERSLLIPPYNSNDPQWLREISVATWSSIVERLTFPPKRFDFLPASIPIHLSCVSTTPFAPMLFNSLATAHSRLKLLKESLAELGGVVEEATAADVIREELVNCGLINYIEMYYKIDKQRAITNFGGVALEVQGVGPEWIDLWILNKFGVFPQISDDTQPDTNTTTGDKANTGKRKERKRSRFVVSEQSKAAGKEVEFPKTFVELAAKIIEGRDPNFGAKCALCSLLPLAPESLAELFSPGSNFYARALISIIESVCKTKGGLDVCGDVLRKLQEATDVLRGSKSMTEDVGPVEDAMSRLLSATFSLCLSRKDVSLLRNMAFSCIGFIMRFRMSAEGDFQLANLVVRNPLSLAIELPAGLEQLYADFLIRVLAPLPLCKSLDIIRQVTTKYNSVELEEGILNGILSIVGDTFVEDVLAEKTEDVSHYVDKTLQNYPELAPCVHAAIRNKVIIGSSVTSKAKEDVNIMETNLEQESYDDLDQGAFGIFSDFIGLKSVVARPVTSVGGLVVCNELSESEDETEQQGQTQTNQMESAMLNTVKTHTLKAAFKHIQSPAPTLSFITAYVLLEVVARSAANKLMDGRLFTSAEYLIVRLCGHVTEIINNRMEQMDTKGYPANPPLSVKLSRQPIANLSLALTLLNTLRMSGLGYSDIQASFSKVGTLYDISLNKLALVEDTIQLKPDYKEPLAAVCEVLCIDETTVLRTVSDVAILDTGRLDGGFLNNLGDPGYITCLLLASAARKPPVGSRPMFFAPRTQIPRAQRNRVDVCCEDILNLCVVLTYGISSLPLELPPTASMSRFQVNSVGDLMILAALASLTFYQLLVPRQAGAAQPLSSFLIETPLNRVCTKDKGIPYFPFSLPFSALCCSIAAALGDSQTNSSGVNAGVGKRYDSSITLYSCKCGNIFSVANCGNKASLSEYNGLDAKAHGMVFGHGKCPRCGASQVAGITKIGNLKFDKICGEPGARFFERGLITQHTEMTGHCLEHFVLGLSNNQMTSANKTYAQAYRSLVDTFRFNVIAAKPQDNQGYTRFLFGNCALFGFALVRACIEAARESQPHTNSIPSGGPNPLRELFGLNPVLSFASLFLSTSSTALALAACSGERNSYFGFTGVECWKIVCVLRCLSDQPVASSPAEKLAIEDATQQTIGVVLASMQRTVTSPKKQNGPIISRLRSLVQGDFKCLTLSAINPGTELDASVSAVLNLLRTPHINPQYIYDAVDAERCPRVFLFTEHLLHSPSSLLHFAHIGAFLAALRNRLNGTHYEVNVVELFLYLKTLPHHINHECQALTLPRVLFADCCPNGIPDPAFETRALDAFDEFLGMLVDRDVREYNELIVRLNSMAKNANNNNNTTTDNNNSNNNNNNNNNNSNRNDTQDNSSSQHTEQETNIPFSPEHGLLLLPFKRYISDRVKRIIHDAQSGKGEGVSSAINTVNSLPKMSRQLCTSYLMKELAVFTRDRSGSAHLDMAVLESHLDRDLSAVPLDITDILHTLKSTRSDSRTSVNESYEQLNGLIPQRELTPKEKETILFCFESSKHFQSVLGQTNIPKLLGQLRLLIVSCCHMPSLASRRTIKEIASTPGLVSSTKLLVDVMSDDSRDCSALATLAPSSLFSFYDLVEFLVPHAAVNEMLPLDYRTDLSPECIKILDKYYRSDTPIAELCVIRLKEILNRFVFRHFANGKPDSPLAQWIDQLVDVYYDGDVRINDNEAFASAGERQGQGTDVVAGGDDCGVVTVFIPRLVRLSDLSSLVKYVDRLYLHRRESGTKRAEEKKVESTLLTNQPTFDAASLLDF